MTYHGMGYPSVKEGCRAGHDIPARYREPKKHANIGYD